VAKPGFSQAQTYDTTDRNVEPDPGHLTVASSSITTASFAIDELSAVDLFSVTPLKHATDTTDFSSTNKIASSSNVTVDDNELRLASQASGFATSGVAYTTEIGTSSVYQWKQVGFQSTTSADTELRLHVVDKSNTGYVRLPDTELNNNSTGFVQSPVDISSISTSSYNRLALELQLTTDNTSTTPRMGTTTTQFQYGRAPIADFDFSVRGEKTIGETSDGDPIYKSSFSTSTNASGTRTLSNLEWDTYHFEPTASNTKRIASACTSEPLNLAPGTTTDLTLAVADISDTSTNTLRVGINDATDGTAVTNATTTLDDGNSKRIQQSGPCGHVFYADLSSNPDYDLTVSAEGYNTTTVNDISVDGIRTVIVELTGS